MATILDYSAGYPDPAAIKRAGHAGAIRYLRKSGTSRVRPLTATERQGFERHGLALALVYQAPATTFITGGATPNINQARLNGEADARWALEQARSVGIPNPRCIYFAADQDIELAREMPAVKAYLSGAATVLGVERVGIYGEYDVLEQCIPGHARWGWQTAAWSGGRRSGKRHLFQRVGQTQVDGILVDINDVHRADFGQINLEDDDMADLNLDQRIGRDSSVEQQFLSHAKKSGTLGHWLRGQRQFAAGTREIVTAMAATLTAVAKGVAGLEGQDDALRADMLAAINGLEERLGQQLDAAVDEINDDDITPEQHAEALVATLPDAVFQALIRYAAESGRVTPAQLMEVAENTSARAAQQTMPPVTE